MIPLPGSSNKSSDPGSAEASVRHRLWYLFCQWLCQIAFVLLFKLRVFDRKRIPRKGPVLFVSNHQSFLDPVLVGVGLRRELHYLARDTLFSHPLFKRLIVSLNALSVRRDEADHAAFRRAIKVLRKDRQLLIFPEGTRTRDGELQKIRPGWALLAARSNATIVPVVIEGAFTLWPRSALLPRPGRIAVAFGEPFRLAGNDRAELDRATEWIRETWAKEQQMLRKRLRGKS